MSKILVTGGAGFIGSHVAGALLARGDSVCVLDNFNDFYAPALKRENAARLTRAQIVSGDIRDQALVAKLFEQGGFDGIVHLAAMAGVRPSLEDPLHYADVNVRGTLILLEQLKQRPTTRFVFASSSSVYGSNERVPFREDDDIHHPVSPYAATKRAGELLAYTYHHLYGVPTACLRFFTVYGPGQRPEMAIAKFTRSIMAKQPIPFFGDGSTRRDYTYVDDIVDGVLACTARDFGYEVFNLGESQTVRLDELIALLEQALGKKALIDRQPPQPGDVPVTYADISKARAKLGYDPQTKIAAGIPKFVEWFRANAT